MIKVIDGFENYTIDEDGVITNIKTKKVRKFQLTRQGYYRVTLADNCRRKAFLVHRLIALAFIPNVDNKPYVNHIDGVKTNISLENLEWCTPRENVLHSYKIGLQSQVGIKNGCNKLSENEVKIIKDLLENFNITYSMIARWFGVSNSTIADIKKERSWKHIII